MQGREGLRMDLKGVLIDFRTITLTFVSYAFRIRRGKAVNRRTLRGFTSPFLLSTASSSIGESSFRSVGCEIPHDLFQRSRGIFLKIIDVRLWFL